MNDVQIFKTDITLHQKTMLNKLLNKYMIIFAKDKFDIGSIEDKFCQINLTSNIPINLRPYRCSLSDQKLINDQVNKLLEKNLIKKSNSPYAFPVTLVDKKDEGKKTRLCIDLRKLNMISIPDNYPFPRIDDIIDKLHNAKYFSTIDICSGFWHIKINPKDTYKLGFITMTDHYEWLVLPFGWRNSPAIFQRIIYNILYKNNLTKFCHNYLDDILIFSDHFDSHLMHLELVLKSLIKENIKLKHSKCRFAQTEVTFLGHVLSLNTMKPLNDNLIPIKKFQIPKDTKHVQQFLGKINYYHKFIKNAPKKLAPLYNLLKKNSKFEWTSECQSAFDKIKTYLTSEPILAIYNPNAECFLFVDASKTGLGSVLKQIQNDNTLKPIAYFSQNFYLIKLTTA